MADNYVQLPVDGGGKKVDHDSLNVGPNQVYRARQVVADPNDPLGLGAVISTPPAGTEHGAVVREAQMGTAGAGIAPPAGGGGVLGWLSGTYQKVMATLAVTQSGTWTVQPGNTPNTTAWKVDGSGATQPVSGADGSQATIGATTDPSSAFTLVGLLKAIKAAVTGTVTVGGTVTANAGTNMSTAALALEGGGNLAAVATNTARLPTPGAALRAAALPVTLATDQPAVPVSGTVTANAGTNTSTAALALEAGGNLATLVTTTGRIPAQGAALRAAALPVTLATDQPAVPVGGTVAVSAVAGALPTGANTIGGVTTVGSGTVIDDSFTVTTTPTALPAHVGNDFQIQNDLLSIPDVLMGNATGQHTRIQPGMSQPVPVTNTSLIYVKTLTGAATVNILGRS